MALLPLCALLLAALVARCVGAPTKYRVGFVDGVASGATANGDDYLCASDTDGASPCFASIEFATTFRFWVDVPARSTINVRVASVTSGPCVTEHDLYMSAFPFASNSLSAFQAAAAFDGKVLNSRDAIVTVALCSFTDTNRIYFGVRALLGTCPSGLVSITIVDRSLECGVTRADGTCYQGPKECANVAPSGGDSKYCCPRGKGSPQFLVGCRCEEPAPITVAGCGGQCSGCNCARSCCANICGGDSLIARHDCVDNNGRLMRNDCTCGSRFAAGARGTSSALVDALGVACVALAVTIAW